MEGCKYHLTVLYFYSLGLWILFIPGIVALMAIEDVLAGTLWSSTTALLIYSVLDVIAKVVSPYIINKISFRSAFAVLTFLLVGSYALLVTIDDIRPRLIGVGGLGVSYGFSMIIGMRMLSYYEHADVYAVAFENGCHTGFLISSLVYTGLTTWACLAPRIALSLCIPFCFLPLVFYYLLDKEPLKDHLKNTTHRQSVTYTALNDEDHCTEDQEPPPSEQMSRILFIYKAFPFMGYAYISNFCMHIVMASVVTTLTFPASPFQPRDHYQYYRLAANIGISFGGYASLLPAFCDPKSKWIEVFTIRKIWILVVLEVCHVVFLVLTSWFRFLATVNVVLVLSFTLGILDGMTLVQCAANSSSEFSSPRDKGTALGLVETAISVGRLFAALLGISTEKLLREHCTDRLLLGKFCLARPVTHAEWSVNLSCKTSKI